MARTFYFYDLETSGINGRSDRIMQFAGIRTDELFNALGEPHNLMVRLTEDVLPSPEALMVTGITPQKTVEEGFSEAEFAKIFISEIATPDTTIVGFNNIRFDDEFMRALLWRNFYDPYEWAYKDGRSRWDLLDAVRMTRALRPDGINWPFVDGKPSNRLELLSKENNLAHENAHDALSDVEALVGLTKLIADKQPQLFGYLLKMRGKNDVKQLVSLDKPEPFVYSSGRYAAEFEKTTVALPIAKADFDNVYVYDLRHDPTIWADMSDDELRSYIEKPYKERDESYVPIPIKKLQYNRAPAVAPLGVLEAHDSWRRIGLSLETIEKNRTVVLSQKKLVERLVRLINERSASYERGDQPAESLLYDGFVSSSHDKMRIETVRNASLDELKRLDPEFEDQRLREIYPRYKARNYPAALNDDERKYYEQFRKQQIELQLPDFLRSMQKIATKDDLSNHQQYVLEELKLWVEAIMPDEYELDDETSE